MVNLYYECPECHVDQILMAYKKKIEFINVLIENIYELYYL